MAILGSLNRIFGDPSALERPLLVSDFPEPSAEPEHQNKVRRCPAPPEHPKVTPAGAGPVNMEARVVEVHQNTDQRFIVVTQDKTLLILKKNIAQLGKKEWLAPLSTVTSIIITLLTSNFKYALWLGPAEWRAMFILGGCIAIGWLSYSVHKAIHAKTFSEVIVDTIHELGGRQPAVRSRTV